MKNLWIFSAAVLLQACTSNSSAAEKHFNSEAFPGLIDIGRSYDDIKLEYALDTRDDQEIYFTSCTQVEKVGESDIVHHQYNLYQLLAYNCLAAKYFHEGDIAESDHLPKNFDTSIITLLPADAIPNRGGNSLEVKPGQSLSSAHTVENINVTDNTLSAEIDLTQISYVKLAEADITGDGSQNWIIRMDWRDTDSFGKGTELLIVSKSNVDGPIVIEVRYPAR